MFNSDIPAPETQVSDLFWDCSGFRQFFVVRHCKIINDFIDNKLQLRRQLSDQSGKIILVRWDESRASNKPSRISHNGGEDP